MIHFFFFFSVVEQGQYRINGFPRNSRTKNDRKLMAEGEKVAEDKNLLLSFFGRQMRDQDELPQKNFLERQRRMPERSQSWWRRREDEDANSIESSYASWLGWYDIRLRPHRLSRGRREWKIAWALIVRILVDYWHENLVA